MKSRKKSSLVKSLVSASGANGAISPSARLRAEMRLSNELVSVQADSSARATVLKASIANWTNALNIANGTSGKVRHVCPLPLYDISV